MADPRLASPPGRAWYGDNAAIVRANGYSPIPIPPGQKRANWRGWQRFCRVLPSDAQVARLCETCTYHGLAIACGRVIAIDIDADNPARVETLTAIARAHFGPTDLVRIGRAPRCVLIYGVPAGVLIATRRLGDIELLGQGAYVMAYGDHPITGRPYRWTASSPAERRHRDLPFVTPEMVAGFVAAVRGETDRIAPAVQSVPGETVRLRPHDDHLPTGPARPDPRWVLDGQGRVADGRDAFLAAQVYRAFASGLNGAENIAAAAFQRFAMSADLTRHARDGTRGWVQADALAKARALLASGKPRPALRGGMCGIDTRSGFWTPPQKDAFRHAINEAGAAGGLSPSAVAVSAAMLDHVQGDSSAFASVATLAARLELAPDTVKRARRALLDAGFWTAERVRGGRGHLAHYRPVAAVLTPGLPTAHPAARTPANGDRSVHPKDQGWGIHSPPGRASADLSTKRRNPREP